MVYCISRTWWGLVEQYRLSIHIEALDHSRTYNMIVGRRYWVWLLGTMRITSSYVALRHRIHQRVMVIVAAGESSRKRTCPDLFCSATGLGAILYRRNSGRSLAPQSFSVIWNFRKKEKWVFRYQIKVLIVCIGICTDISILKMSLDL